MEHQDKETFLELKEHNSDRFANTDFQLRSGMHIQDYRQQSRNFHFIEDNFPQLYSFYEKLYQARLCPYQSINGKFYYLDYFEEQKSKLQRESLKPKQTFSLQFFFTHYIELKNDFRQHFQSKNLLRY